jgi:hypothetical protein
MKLVKQEVSYRSWPERVFHSKFDRACEQDSEPLSFVKHGNSHEQLCTQMGTLMSI